MRAVNQCDL